MVRLLLDGDFQSRMAWRVRSRLRRPGAAALAGGRDSHRLAVLGDGAARHRYSLAREQLGDAAVVERILRVLFLDELADLGADRRRGGAGAVGALDLTREEVAQLEYAA